MTRSIVASGYGRRSLPAIGQTGEITPGSTFHRMTWPFSPRNTSGVVRFRLLAFSESPKLTCIGLAQSSPPVNPQQSLRQCRVLIQSFLSRQSDPYAPIGLYRCQPTHDDRPLILRSPAIPREKQTAAAAYLSAEESLIPETLTVWHIDIDQTQTVNDNSNKVYFTVTYLPKVSIDDAVDAMQKASTNQRSIQAELVRRFLANEFGHSMIRARLESEYTDFQAGKSFTKVYPVRLSKTDDGWAYLPF